MASRPRRSPTTRRTRAKQASSAARPVFTRQWVYPYGLLPNKEQSGIEAAQVGVAEVPVAHAGLTSVNVGGGWNFFINAGCRNQDDGWKLIQYLSAPEQQKAMAVG